MKVSELQQVLSRLGPLLESCGAKVTSVTDLKTITVGLTPFAQMGLADFAGFLARADEFARIGAVPLKPLPAGKAKKEPAPKPAVAGPAESVSKIKSLWERAASLTVDEIEAETACLNPLTKDGLVAVAEAIELKGMKAKKKDDIAAAIRQRIRERLGATQRAGLVDRPASETANGTAGAVLAEVPSVSS